MTKREMLERLDSVELTEWQARDRVSPLDAARRAELSAGIIASLIHNASYKPAKPASDFMRDWGDQWRGPEVTEVRPDVYDAKLDAFFHTIAAKFKAGG